MYDIHICMYDVIAACLCLFIIDEYSNYFVIYQMLPSLYTNLSKLHPKHAHRHKHSLDISIPRKRAGGNSHSQNLEMGWWGLDLKFGNQSNMNNLSRTSERIALIVCGGCIYVPTRADYRDTNTHTRRIPNQNSSENPFSEMIIKCA